MDVKGQRTTQGQHQFLRQTGGKLVWLFLQQQLGRERDMAAEKKSAPWNKHIWKRTRSSLFGFNLRHANEHYH